MLGDFKLMEIHGNYLKFMIIWLKKQNSLILIVRIFKIEKNSENICDDLNTLKSIIGLIRFSLSNFYLFKILKKIFL